MKMATANSSPNTSVAPSPLTGTVTLDGDCNDDDNTVYPNAPGTGIGIDNNCNGVIDSEEEEPQRVRKTSRRMAQ